MKKWLPLFLLIGVIWSCSEKGKEERVFKPDVSNLKVTFEFLQFQDSLASIKSKKELLGILKRNPLMRDYIFRRSEYPDDSAFVNELYRKFTDPNIDTLLQDTKRVFGDLTNLKSQFKEAFTNIKYYFPDYNPPKVYTVISGLDTDLLVTDSIIIVSLDSYLGKGARYRPKYYDYLLRRYEPEDIVPSCLLIYGIDDRLNRTELKDKTILAEMVAYGKSYYFARHMLPCVPDSTFMWYTTPDINGARENEDLIWARFIQDKILFSTSMMDKRDYLGERPYTIQVGEKCPGRIGQWVGWQIVNQYMAENPNIKLPELMKMNNAQQLFKDSKYKPKKR